MFATPASLKKRTGKHDVNRPTYLRQLIDELARSSDDSKQEQILANLANFAYDPINYEYFRRFGVIDVFLEVLRAELAALKSTTKPGEASCTAPHVKSESASQGGSNENKLSFAIAGICNLCLDAKNKKLLLANGILTLVSDLIACFINNSTANTEILINLLELVVFLVTNEEEKADAARLLAPSLRSLLQHAVVIGSADKRLRNIAELISSDLLSRPDADVE